MQSFKKKGITNEWVSTDDRWAQRAEKWFMGIGSSCGIFIRSAWHGLLLNCLRGVTEAVHWKPLSEDPCSGSSWNGRKIWETGFWVRGDERVLYPSWKHPRCPGCAWVFIPLSGPLWWWRLPGLCLKKIKRRLPKAPVSNQLSGSQAHLRTSLLVSVLRRTAAVSPCREYEVDTQAL